MNRLLLAPEILHSLCKHLADRQSPDEGLTKHASSALAKLARTHTAFTPSALDELWAFQDTIRNLLGCMEDPGEYRNVVWSRDGRLLRPLLPEHIKRGQLYAQRVKVFAVSEKTYPAVSLHLSLALRALRLALGAECLLPNLRRLRFVFPNELELLTQIFPLLSPKLTHLVLGKVDTHLHLTMLPQIAKMCPQLKDVVLKQDSDKRRTRDTGLTPFIDSLTSVQTLSLDYLSGNDFLHIAYRPSLLSLTITSLLEFPYRREPQPSLPMFMALQHLEFGAKVADTHSFLMALEFAHLVSLKLDINPAPVPVVVRSVYIALRDTLKNSHATLTRLSILSTGRQAANTANGAAFDSMFVKCVNQFTALTHLAIDPPLHMEFTDETILDLVEPLHTCLISLSLGSYAKYSRVSFRSVMDMGLCRKLQMLTLAVDTRQVLKEPWNMDLRVLLTQRELVEWDVGLSPLAGNSELRMRIASILSAIYPNLIAVYNTDSEAVTPDDREHWADLTQVLLPACKLIRKEERQYVRAGYDEETDCSEEEEDQGEDSEDCEGSNDSSSDSGNDDSSCDGADLRSGSESNTSLDGDTKMEYVRAYSQEA
ncbi:hypothetical protein C8F01DRAFT_1301070 [Mycena amicta]|nr:hypothetical protein C8F01DRAFT_1301070 [Mycena amicta]